jgi:hypothetical protein
MESVKVTVITYVNNKRYERTYLDVDPERMVLNSNKRELVLFYVRSNVAVTVTNLSHYYVEVM